MVTSTITTIRNDGGFEAAVANDEFAALVAGQRLRFEAVVADDGFAALAGQRAPSASSPDARYPNNPATEITPISK